MTPLADATRRLLQAQASHFELWALLFARLGRCEQALASNDLAEARHWMHEAEDAEYDLLGSCENTGAAAILLGLE